MAGLVAVLALSVGGCGREKRRDATPQPSADTDTYTLTVDGRERHYRAHLPQGGADGKPVVIFLHGGGGNGELFERITHMDTVGDFVVIYPDGSGRLGDKLLTWNAGDCCAYAKDQNIDDVAFVRALIDDVRHRLKTTKVFVTGFSNGAMMTYRLGCELADKVDAIAVVSGAMNLDTCAPARQIPVLVMHGTADTAVPYDGGPSSDKFPTAGTWTNRSVQYAVDFWTRHNACTATPTSTTDGAVTQKTWTCAREVTLYTIDDGGHGWPGGEKARPNAVEEAPPRPDASQVIWDFFATAV